MDRDTPGRHATPERREVEDLCSGARCAFERAAEPLPKHVPHAGNPGDSSGEATPVPIPNTEVKLSSAEDTERAAFRENRPSPGFLRFRGGLNRRRPDWARSLPARQRHRDTLPAWTSPRRTRCPSRLSLRRHLPGPRSARSSSRPTGPWRGAEPAARPPLLDGDAQHPARPGAPAPILRRVRWPGVLSLRRGPRARAPRVDAACRRGSGSVRSDPETRGTSPMGGPRQRRGRGRGPGGVPPCPRSRRTGFPGAVGAARRGAVAHARQRRNDRGARVDPAITDPGATRVSLAGSGRLRVPCAVGVPRAGQWPYLHRSSG